MQFRRERQEQRAMIAEMRMLREVYVSVCVGVGGQGLVRVQGYSRAESRGWEGQG